MDAIQTLHVESYGCIKNATFALTPLHALIGPNDSGKSTVLRALRTVTQFAGGAFSFDQDDPVNPQRPFDPMIDKRPDGLSIEVSYADKLAYRLYGRNGELAEHVSDGQEPNMADAERTGWNNLGLFRHNNDPRLAPLRARLKPARLVRLDPDAMRQPSPLIQENARVSLRDERGTGLAGVYDVIRNRNLKGATAILADVEALFPNVADVGLFNVSDKEKILKVTLKSGEAIVAPAMSEGLLYYLAFAALKYLDPVSLLLVEEPENGLHPARIADVMRVLREISKTTQVVIATHSPLVINELHADEVSVVTRSPERGTGATLLSNTFNYAERSKVYSNGELWLSYANGEDEHDLLSRPEQVE